jgi:nucleoside-diphosphate-sugar epimerase
MAADLSANPLILVIGASGLIGHFIAVDLARRGHLVVAVARSFEPAQKFSLSGSTMVEAPVVEQEFPALARLLEEQRAEVVVNCLGVLHDRPAPPRTMCTRLSSAASSPRSARSIARFYLPNSVSRVERRRIAPRSA